MNFRTTTDGTPRTPRPYCSGTHRAPNSHPTFGKNILANTFIDFNQIFSQIFHPVERQISDFGEWAYTWDKYEKAVLFAFPHRELELQQYKKHIQEIFLFLAQPGVYKDVLQYDRRVRKRVAESGSLRLCDFSEFSSDYLSFIINGDDSDEN
jgi:hypothetical protein